MQFIRELDPFQQFFWYTALLSSVLFLGQSLLAFMGAHDGDATADFDSDLDADPGMHFHVFSFRNFVNFLLGFGWGGISLFSLTDSKTLILLFALSCGIGMVGMFFYIMRRMTLMAENNVFQINQALGKSAEVYLKIPADGLGKGKVLLSVGGSVHELDAITRSAEIPSGTLVKVITVENNQLLVVEKL
jgi:hypothetical protein